jgi:hypothetical protein
MGGLILCLAAAIYLRDHHWIAALVAMLGVAAFVSIMGPIWATEIGVTNQRLIYKRGLVARAKGGRASLHRGGGSRTEPARPTARLRARRHGTGVADIVLPSMADHWGCAGTAGRHRHYNAVRAPVEVSGLHPRRLLRMSGFGAQESMSQPTPSTIKSMLMQRPMNQTPRPATFSISLRMK